MLSNIVSIGTRKYFAVSAVTTSIIEYCPSALTTIVFATCLLPCRAVIRCYVSPEIRCSGMSSRYCCYGTNTAGFKPI